MRIFLNNLCDFAWLSRARETRFHAHALALRCGASPRTLERYFVASFERPPQAWLDELRLCLAAELLRAQHPVKEVGFDLGFANTSHFCREFKQYYGCTPVEFTGIMEARLTQSRVRFRDQGIAAGQAQLLDYARKLDALFHVHREHRPDTRQLCRCTMGNYLRCKAEYPFLHLRCLEVGNHQSEHEELAHAGPHREFADDPSPCEPQPAMV